MNKNNFNDDEISRLINQAINNGPNPLRAKFQQRLSELDISFNQARENLEISYRALNGILDGTLEQIDFLSLLKIAQFLEIQYDEITKLYADVVSSKHKVHLQQAEKRTFILNNFDLAGLKNIGIIDSIRDFDHIEQKLKEILGLNSIMDYNDDDFEVVFSSETKVPKDLRSRKYFIRKARKIFKVIENPNSYQKEALIDYFPKIRWQSIDIQNGLVSVIKLLYKLGITVIFQPSIPGLQMRGATFSVNDKPCIVLTDFKGYYPTLWFALIHELFHVIFDWSDILQKKYHLSLNEEDVEVVRQKEHEADEFAREYMFPKKKMEEVSNRILDRLYVRGYAIENHVHPSIVYANYAYDNTTTTVNYWQKFQKLKLMPQFSELTKKLSNDFAHTTKAVEFAAYYKLNIFNKK